MLIFEVYHHHFLYEIYILVAFGLIYPHYEIMKGQLLNGIDEIEIREEDGLYK